MSRSDDELDALLGALGPPAGAAPTTPARQILSLVAPPPVPMPSGAPVATGVSTWVLGGAVSGALVVGLVGGALLMRLAGGVPDAPGGEPMSTATVARAPAPAVSPSEVSPSDVSPSDVSPSDVSPNAAAAAHFAADPLAADPLAADGLASERPGAPEPSGASENPPTPATSRAQAASRAVVSRGSYDGRARVADDGAGGVAGVAGVAGVSGRAGVAIAAIGVDSDRADANRSESEIVVALAENANDDAARTLIVSQYSHETPANVGTADHPEVDVSGAGGPTVAAPDTNASASVDSPAPAPPLRGRTRRVAEGADALLPTPAPASRWSLAVDIGSRAFPEAAGAPPDARGAPRGAAPRVGADAGLAARLDLAPDARWRPTFELGADIGAALAPSVGPPVASAQGTAELLVQLGAFAPALGVTAGIDIVTARAGGAGTRASGDAPIAPFFGGTAGVDIGRPDQAQLRLRVDLTAPFVDAGAAPALFAASAGVELPLGKR